MEKKSVFSNIILFLCFIALIVNTVEINQIRLYTKSPYTEALIQKIRYNYFSQPVKLGQKFISENNAEITIKDKGFAEKITAPVTVVKENFWGEPYNITNSYSVKDPDNRFVYANANIKSLYNKKIDIEDLINAKMIFAGKYEFDCDVIKTTKDKTDFVSDVSIMPLQSEDVYIISELPKNFVNSKNPLELEFKIDNTKYVMKLR